MKSIREKKPTRDTKRKKENLFYEEENKKQKKDNCATKREEKNYSIQTDSQIQLIKKQA